MLDVTSDVVADKLPATSVNLLTDLQKHWSCSLSGAASFSGDSHSCWVPSLHGVPQRTQQPYSEKSLVFKKKKEHRIFGNGSFEGKCESEDCIGLQKLLSGRRVTAPAFHYPSRKCVIIVVLHLVLSIEQHDESGEIMLSGSATMRTHFFTHSFMYRSDKSIPVEPLSFCLTGGAVTDVHR